MLQVVDVGTNNLKLREDEYYLGLHQERVSGNAYYELLDEVSFLLCNLQLNSFLKMLKWHMIKSQGTFRKDEKLIALEGLE